MFDGNPPRTRVIEDELMGINIASGRCGESSGHMLPSTPRITALKQLTIPAVGTVAHAGEQAVWFVWVNGDGTPVSMLQTGSPVQP